MKNEQNVNLLSSMDGQIITLGKVDPYIRLGNLRAKTTFNVIEAIFVNIVVGTNFMDKHVTSIHFTKRWLIPRRSRLTVILSSRASDKLAITTALSQEEKEHCHSDYNYGSEMIYTVKLRVAKRL